jgi:regulatory protein
MRSRATPTARPEKPLTPATLERSALWHLSRRALTKAQLQALLHKKAARAAAVHGPSVDAATWIDALLSRLQDSLLVDDARVAQARVASGRAAGRSRRALRARLKRHGVDEATAAQALANVDADVDGDAELQAAVTWAKKKSLAAKDRQKALAALARQGFSFDVAKRALDAARADEDPSEDDAAS